MENQAQENLSVTDSSDKMFFLLNTDNNTASIVLIEKACEQYQSLYKKNNVPYSYIRFFCEEFNKYSGLFTNKLKKFYEDYVSLNLTSEDLIDCYVKSFYAQHEGVITTKHETFLNFKQPIVLTFTKEMREVNNIDVSTMVENIINICHKIDTQDELLNVVELYERYMITQYIKTHEFKISKKQKNDDISADVTTQEKPDKVQLVSTPLEDNYESYGKVTKIIIPKLNLPSNYPVSVDQSRLTENKKTSKFCAPAKQIVFINHKKIVAVKYSNKFLEKRTIKKKKKKFDWDF